jgi:hypothetical protein
MRNERSVRIDISAFAILLLSAFSLSAASLSSLSCNDRLDNNREPVPVVPADENHELTLQIDADWFGESEVSLFTNGVLAASSTGEVEEFVLKGSPDTYTSYFLSVKAGDKEFTKVVTIFPSADYTCSLHSLSRDRQRLDSRAAGTLRKILAYLPLDISWSSLWNEGAEAPVVKLYKGADASGEELSILLDSPEAEEGLVAMLPESEDLKDGVYTLTHFDGVETLTAYIKVKNRSLYLLLK